MPEMTLWRNPACTLSMASFLIFFSTHATALAEFIVSVDLDPAAGIQSTNTVPVNLNDEITATFFMEMTAPSTLRAYEFSIRFGDGLQYVGRSELGFGTLVGDQNTNNNLVQNGIASGFDAGIIGNGSYATPTGPVSIGSMTFKVIGTSNLTIEPGLFDGGVFDLFVDGASNEVPLNEITFNPGSVNITSVPEPGSMALVIVSVFGLCFLKRRRIQRSC